MRNRVHNIELDEFVSDQMQCPSSISLECFRTGDHRDICFNLIIEYNWSSNTWLIIDNFNNMVIRLSMILLSYIINGSSSDPEKLCTLLILLALLRQEQGSCTVDVSSFFVTSSDIRGQKIMFVLA